MLLMMLRHECSIDLNTLFLNKLFDKYLTMKILFSPLLFLVFQALMPMLNAQSTYTNPVLRGFYPDPSTICVGNDFYTVTSTFEYFPAVCITHSTDLVNWHIEDYVFNQSNPIDLRHFYDGCGIWAPDLSYHDGEFYLFYCLVQLKKDRSVNVRGNYMTKSKSIHGPWSKPVQLTDYGSDPSHFVDSDGTHYMLFAAGIPQGNGTKIVKLNDACDQIVEGPFWMEIEGKKAAPEAPHLYRKDGYYYFMMAASAGAFNGHHQLLARSKSVYGPYESFPNNPLIAQYNTKSINHHQGHGKLIQAPDGEYYMTVISQRREPGIGVSGQPSPISQCGRETSLYPMEWTSDGWLRVKGVDIKKGLPDIYPMPNLKPTTLKDKHSDNFDNEVLGLQWMSVRNPVLNDYSLTQRKGHLRLFTTHGTLDSQAPQNAFLQRETEQFYTATTKMEFQPKGDEQAGLLCRYDSKCYVSLSLRAGADNKLVLEEMRAGVQRVINETSVRTDAPIYLRVEVNKLHRAFYFSYDNKEWHNAGVIQHADFLSDQGTPQWGFMGTMVGVYALDYGSGNRIAADFDWFHYDTTTIMGVGDSITQGGGSDEFPSYIEWLKKYLIEDGGTAQFIGPRTTSNSRGVFNHCGFGGKNAQFLDSVIVEIYSAYPAQILLVHCGHNHFSEEKPVDGIVAAQHSIIQKVKRINPSVKVLLSSVISSGKLPKYSYISELNCAIKQLVLQLDDPNVVFIETDRGFDWTKHTIADKVHPNSEGARVMANNCYEALSGMIEKSIDK